MKKSLSIVLLGIAVAVMAHVSSISWKTTSLDLGKVKSNELKELAFEFTNNGQKAITIFEANGSCGCTVVSFPKESIAPGQTAVIKANFKSSTAGAFRKNIKVKTSESEEYTYLNFSGEVVE